MEKWKRMEFKGIAKIVILAIVILAITGITVIGATTSFDPKDCPDCSESELEFSCKHNHSYDYYDYSECYYHSSDIQSIKEASGYIAVTEYNNAERAITAFKNIRQFESFDRSEEGVLSNDDTKCVAINCNKHLKYLDICGYFLHKEKNVVIKVFMHIGTLGCVNDNDIKEAKTRFDAFAKCAHSITGWKDTETKEEKYTLTLEQYPPYYKPGKNDPRRAGDLVATLTDKDGNGVSGKRVFFYLEHGTNLKGVLKNTVWYPHPDWILIEQNFSMLSYFGDAETDYDGIAIFNYIRCRCIKKEILSERIRDTGENIKGPIVAGVFNEKFTTIEQDESVVVEFSGIAKITNISIHCLKEEALNRDGGIILKRAVNKQNELHIFVHERECQLEGYNLLYGDIISLDKDDYIELLWMDGMKICIKTKPDVLKEDMVDITIGKTGLEDQIRNDLYEIRQNSVFNTIVLSGCGVAIGIYTMGASTAILGYTGVALGLAEIAFAVEGICYGEIPYIVMRPKSKILVDPTSSGINFYTVEGSNELITPKGFKRDITTGYKVRVLPDGTFSQISGFDRSELNEDLSYLLESMEKDESENIVPPVLAPKRSELEISKLYVGKPIYPRGTEVDVYYDVKNIGTVDVDEYYVECRINDLKGNELYKFVGSTRSIASGKRQKFVAAEKWKIPSNAKLGPYKITATVKWNSRTHTKTTNEELFVTIATISENSKAELEISELYTLKKEYSKNEKVEMCYCVKNIGSKKVKQSHMRCAFINPNGEKLEWFITAPFSLAGKDKRKRCFTGESAVWKIPSDAEQGTYTIEVTVIWGSKSHTKTTDFKVK